MQIVRSGYPMERMVFDILGELPVPESGNKNIHCLLVVAEYAIKWTESFFMPHMESESVVKIIVEDVI